MVRLLVCVLIVFATFVQCENRAKLEKIKRETKLRGDFMNLGEDKKLMPEIATSDCPIDAAASINIPNKFACVDGGSFAYATVGENYTITCQKIIDKFPGTSVADFQADESGSLMWGREGYRGLFALSVPDNITINTVPADGNLYGGIPLVARNSFLLLANMEPGGFGEDANNSFFIAFDMKTGKRLYDNQKAGPFLNNLYQLSGNHFLGEEWKSDKKPGSYSNWCWIDVNEDGFSKTQTDPFTEMLTQKKIKTGWEKLKRVDFNKRFLIGRIVTSPLDQFVSVRWKADFKDVKVDSLILQCSTKLGFGDYWNLSPDGNWLCVKASVLDAEDRKHILIFYNVDDKYPQGLSMPVYGGYTAIPGDGCFVNHSVLGPLYIDFSSDTKAMLIYKLIDAIALLK
jgi:hypothetical protein